MGYLLITNDIEPYYRDVVNLMAQHYGAIYRFRYERSDDFDLIGPIEPGDMENQEGLIVLRCAQGAKFVPIRRIRIERVFDSRFLVVVQFSLLDFPDPSAKSRWNLIHEIIVRQAVENTIGGALRPLIFHISDTDVENALGAPVTDATPSKSEDFDRWMSVIHSLSGLNVAKTSCFLYLHDIYEDDVTPVGRSRILKGALTAGPDASYKLTIASYSLPPSSKPHDERDALPEFSLILKVDSALVAPIEESSAVTSRYDDHTVSFRTKGESSGVGTSVSINPTGVQAGLYVPTIELPVYIKIAGWQWSSVALAAILYVVSLFGIPGVIEKPAEVWAKLLQAGAIFLVASIGKDSVGPLLKAGWNSRPLADLRNTLAEMRENRPR